MSMRKRHASSLKANSLNIFWRLHSFSESADLTLPLDRSELRLQSTRATAGFLELSHSCFAQVSIP